MSTYTLGDGFDISEYGFRIDQESLGLPTFGNHEGSSLVDIVISDHVARALALLLEQFEHRHDVLKSNDTNLKGTLSAFVNEMQSLEFAVSGTYKGRLITFALGAQLDLIGGIVGQSRLVGESDGDYRDSILFKIQLNSSHGEPELLIAYIGKLVGGGMVILNELFPGKVVIFVNSVQAFTISGLSSKVDRAAAAGVKCEIIANASDNPFRYCELTLPTPVYGDGFSELVYSPAIGGNWSELLP